jgi:transposase-like protein
MRNILCKLTKKIEKEIKPLIKQVFYASSYEEGMELGKELVARFKDRYTLTMECLEEDLEQIIKKNKEVFACRGKVVHRVRQGHGEHR